MATEPELLPDGQILMVSDRLILADRFELASVAGFLLGGEGTELAIHLTLSGRINKSTDLADVTVALPPRFAYDLAGAILDNLELLSQPTDDKEPTA